MKNKNKYFNLFVNQFALIVFINIPIIVFLIYYFEKREKLELTVNNFVFVWLISFLILYGLINLIRHLYLSNKSLKTFLNDSTTKNKELQDNYNQKLKELDSITDKNYNISKVHTQYENYKKEQDKRIKEYETYLQKKYENFMTEYKDKIDLEYKEKNAEQDLFQENIKKLINDNEALSSITRIDNEFERLKSFLNRYSIVSLIDADNISRIITDKLSVAKESIYINISEIEINSEFLNSLPEIRATLNIKESIFFEKLNLLTGLTGKNHIQLTVTEKTPPDFMIIDNSEIYLFIHLTESGIMFNISGYDIVNNFMEHIRNKLKRKYEPGTVISYIREIDKEKNTLFLENNMTLYYYDTQNNIKPGEYYNIIYDRLTGYILYYDKVQSEKKEETQRRKDGLPF